MASTGGQKKSMLESLESILSGAGEPPQQNPGPQPTAAKPPAKEGGARSPLDDLELLIGGDKPKTPEIPPPPPPSSPEDTAMKPPPPQDPAASSDSKRLTTPELLGLRVQVQIQEIQRRIPPDVVRRMREEVLGPAGFRVDLAEEAFEFLRTGFVGGHVFRGKIRDGHPDVLPAVQRRAKEVFGSKYEVIIIPEPPRYDEELAEFNPDTAPPAFLLVSEGEVAARPQGRLTYVAVAILVALTLLATYFTAFQVGLADLAPAQLTALLEAASEEGVVAILQRNAGTIFSVALPVGAAILGSAAAHDVAHRVAAGRYGVRLSPPLFLPNTSVGTLGSITRIRSLVPDKDALFDIAASGPLVGGAVALGCFVVGLSYTLAGAADPSFVPLPEPLVQSSLLLGGVVKQLLGSDARVHPLLLGGWLALLTTALNSLPIGTSDGGRIMQTLVPRGRKQAASLLVLVSLGLGVVAPRLGFTWGLITVLLQNGSERNVRDQFTPVSALRRATGIALIVLSLLILLPQPYE
jgi:membrane-associated protease RseP (regulator of RpoE activity)